MPDLTPVPRTPPRAARAGFTLVELMIALIMAGIVLGAAIRVLNNNQRYYRAQGEVTELRENLRSAALILPAEFRELAPSQGDIISMSDTSISIRAMRILAFVCAPPNKTTGLIITRTSQTKGWRAVDPTRDSALVFVDADSTKSSDDHWLTYGVSAVGTGVCTNGSAGTTYTLTSTANTALMNSFDSTYVGAPVRFFERVRYRLFNDGTNTWWLGTESKVSGAYNTISQVAGPLQPTTGLKFTFYDSTGAVTATNTLVRSIGVTVRGKSTNQINVAGRPTGYYYDSLQVRTALRNR